jgi:hypothetical protein
MRPAHGGARCCLAGLCGLHGGDCIVEIVVTMASQQAKRRYEYGNKRFRLKRTRLIDGCLRFGYVPKGSYSFFFHPSVRGLAAGSKRSRRSRSGSWVPHPSARVGNSAGATLLNRHFSITQKITQKSSRSYIETIARPDSLSVHIGCRAADWHCLPNELAAYRFGKPRNRACA